jgi:chitin synthase
MTNQDYELYNYKLSVFNVRNMIDSIPDVINFVYIMLLFANLLYSCLVNNNNVRFKGIYYISSTLFGIYGVVVFVLLIINTAKIIIDMVNGTGREEFIISLVWLRALIIFVIVGHALPILWTFSFRKYVEMITSLLSYLYYSPTYINLIQIFAFARIDDLSWGTKGLDMAETDSIEREWEKRKYIFVLQFVSSNVSLSYVLVKLS